VNHYKSAVLLAVLAAASGCERARPVEAASPPPVARAVAGEVFGTGTLESEQSISLGFRVSGRLKQLASDQGDRVVSGQLLATLDPDQARGELELAAAGQGLAASGAARAAAEVRQLEASLDLASKDRQRISELAAAGVVSRAVLDEAEARLAEAEARLQAARAALQVAEGAVVQAARAVGVRQVTLADQQLRSPVEGLVVRRHQESGDVLAAGAPVFTLVSTRKLWVRAWVDETALRSLHEGQATRIVFRSDPGRSFRGRVDRVGHESDRQTHELLVDVELLERPQRLAIGQRADVFVKAEAAR
jgi:RND family efflux transporter MFP subunit